MATRPGTGMDSMVSNWQGELRSLGLRGMGLTLPLQMIDLARFRVDVVGVFN